MYKTKIIIFCSIIKIIDEKVFYLTCITQQLYKYPEDQLYCNFRKYILQLEIIQLLLVILMVMLLI